VALSGDFRTDMTMGLQRLAKDLAGNKRGGTNLLT